jgi:hypothetical protein
MPGSTHPPQQKQADERRADGVDLDCFLPRPLARQTDRFPMRACPSSIVESGEGEMPRYLPSCGTFLPVRVDDAAVQNRHVQRGGVGETTFELGHEAGARVIAFQVQVQTRDVAFVRGPRRFFYVPFRGIATRCYAGCDDDAGTEGRKVHGSS